jgi:hypothetical protein
MFARKPVIFMFTSCKKCISEHLVEVVLFAHLFGLGCTPQQYSF